LSGSTDNTAAVPLAVAPTQLSGAAAGRRPRAPAANPLRTMLLLFGLAFGACAIGLFGALQCGLLGDNAGANNSSKGHQRKGAVRVAACDSDEEKELDEEYGAYGEEEHGEEDYDDEEQEYDDQYAGEEEPLEEDEDIAPSLVENDDGGEEIPPVEENGAAHPPNDFDDCIDEFDLALKRKEATRHASNGSDVGHSESGNPWGDETQTKKKKKKKGKRF